MKKVAVIGAGITGLSAAYALKNAGYRPLLFETTARPGGVVRSERIDGFLVETGPNTLQENSDEVAKLLIRIGADGEAIEANPAAKNRYIIRNGKPVALPASPPGIFSTNALSVFGKLRLLTEPFHSAPPMDGPEESVADFARRRIGRECLDYLVDPFVSGIFAGDPERLSLRYAFPQLHALEREHGSLLKGMRASAKTGKKRPSRLISFPDGLNTLVTKLNESVGKQIYKETTVDSIEPEDGGWKLLASRYDRQIRERFDAIVFATPARALARMSLKSDYNYLSRLGEIEYPPAISVFLGYSRDQVAHPLNGFGLLAPAIEKRNVLGILFSSTLFPTRSPDGQVLLTLILGGARRADLFSESDETLLRIARDEAADLLGITGDPTFQHITRWERAIPQLNVGHGRFIEAIESFEKRHPGLFIAGNFRDGVSLGNCLTGGAERGRQAAAYLDQLPERPPKDEPRNRPGPNGGARPQE